MIERAASTPRCRQCHKPIVWPGLCYTCATGVPRQLRPRKNTEDEKPVHAVAASVEPDGFG